jgi:hypothetical protein
MDETPRECSAYSNKSKAVATHPDSVAYNAGFTVSNGPAALRGQTTLVAHLDTAGFQKPTGQIEAATTFEVAAFTQPDNVPHSEKPHGKCQNCNERDATQTWVGEGGVMAWTHGMYQYWCELCCTQAQLKYAEEAAARIPELKEKLVLLGIQAKDQNPQ